jgi:hypothetical protein
VTHGEAEYRRHVAAARENPAVVGLILTGSRGRAALVRPDSDWDVRLVVADDASKSAAAGLATPHGSPVEVVVFSLGSFAEMGQVGSATEWDRYSYAHCQVVLDKLGGRIAEIAAKQATLSTEEAGAVAADALDGYINAYYRALKNVGVGLVAEAHLDAAESVAPLLKALFAMHGRVRPFNRFLTWELTRFPLPGLLLDVQVLVPRLRSIIGSAEVEDQASLFRDVEGMARARDLGAVVDSWEPDVAWLRSGHPDGRTGDPASPMTVVS